MERPRPGWLRALLVVVLAASGLRAPAADDARRNRLSALEDEMKRLQGELAGLTAREQSVLGDIARLDVEIALRRAQLEDVTLRRRDTEARLADRSRDLATIEGEQSRRAPQLAARIRELYKRGSMGLLVRAMAPVGSATGLDGFRYASYLSRHDAAQLAAWRTSSQRLDEDRKVLSDERTRLTALQADAERRDAELSAGRASRAALLARIRGDRLQHEKALGELGEAARNLSRLVESVGEAAPSGGLDVRKFHGLLDWPADGPVSARFGTVIHPRFRTEIPHPGWDIDAPEGKPFRAVFDGRVAFAAPLAGYGLTAVVDHGNGIVSVYAHAAVLLVEAGSEVQRGQELGKVGDSGSLRGPYLYFELRDTGRAVDPSSWLRPR